HKADCDSLLSTCPGRCKGRCRCVAWPLSEACAADGSDEPFAIARTASQNCCEAHGATPDRGKNGQAAYRKYHWSVLHTLPFARPVVFCCLPDSLAHPAWSDGARHPWRACHGNRILDRADRRADLAGCGFPRSFRTTRKGADRVALGPADRVF